MLIPIVEGILSVAVVLDRSCDLSTFRFLKLWCKISKCTESIFFLHLHLQVKAWAELLNAFCTSGRLELELIYKVQTQCYEDAKLMKLFPEIIRTLYDQDVLAEDTILLWFRKGSNPKGRYFNSASYPLFV